VLGKTSAAKGTPEWTAMEDAVRQFANDFGAVCNSAEAIELIEAKGGTNMPFEPLIDRMDKALAIMWRGGDLGTASGKGADATGASLQGDETDVLEQDDAAWISEILQTSLVRQVVEYHFGTGTRPLAYVQIRTRDRKDTRLDLEMFKTLADLGVPLTLDAALERFGLAKPRPDEELLQRSAGSAGSAGSPEEPDAPPPEEPLANEVAAALGVPAGWVAPIEGLLADMQAKAVDATVSDSELMDFFAETQARLPELLGGMDVEALASVFEASLGAATLEGVRRSLKNRSATAARYARS
jgi:phage gp29-like protein